MTITVEFAKLDLPGCTHASCKGALRDLWGHVDLGVETGSYSAVVDAHGTAAFKLEVVAPTAFASLGRNARTDSPPQLNRAPAKMAALKTGDMVGGIVSKTQLWRGEDPTDGVCATKAAGFDCVGTTCSSEPSDCFCSCGYRVYGGPQPAVTKAGTALSIDDKHL